MNLVFNSIFWGVVLILLGSGMVLNAVFGIKLPFFKIIVALLFIYVGVKILTGNACCRQARDAAWCGDVKISAVQPSGKYDIVCGRGRIDLSSAVLKKGESFHIDVNAVFSSCLINIDPAVPLKITVDSAFAGASMPDGNTIAFGQYIYKSESYREGKDFLDVKAAVVFGELKIITD